MKDHKIEVQLQLWGWILFIVCALLYIVSSLQSGSMLDLLGSLAFLFACVLFIIPLTRRAPEPRE